MTRILPRRAVAPQTALAALTALALAGCGRDAGVLARVNGEPITIEQFNDVAAASLGRYSGSPDSMKAQLLSDLMDRELLVQGALGERLDGTPEFQNLRRTVERQVLREALFQRLLSGPFPVSDAEVKTLHERRATATRARLIFSYDEDLARVAAGDIARGDSFATVADRYNPAGMVPPGGDIGFVQAGSLLPPLDELVRTTATGQVVGPVPVGSDGWFLVRIEERRPQPQPPFEEVRGQLAEMLRQRKQRVVATRVVDRLRVAYQIELQPGAAQALIEKLRPVPDESPTIRQPPPPGPEDRPRVLARYQGGAYTLGDAYDDLVAGSPNRLDFAMLPSVELWIKSQALERAALIEAHRRRLHEEPAIRRRIRERLNNSLLEGFYQRHVIARIQVGPEDLRTAYQRFQASFVRLRSARVVSVTFADSAAAATLAAQAATAPNFADAATAVGGRVSEETLAFPADSPLWTRFENHLMAMSPGQAAGPYPTENGWLLFQLVEKRQEAPSFETLAPATLNQLQSVAIEMKREARLRALTDSLRQAFAPIVIYSDRLRRLNWPPQSPPGSAGA